MCYQSAKTIDNWYSGMVGEILQLRSLVHRAGYRTY